MEFRELNTETWPLLESLFGDKGACGGCWCMTWRLRASEYEKLKGAGNKKAFKKIVSGKFPTGILAIENRKAIGWCSISPREHFARLENSRVLKRVDDAPVWSIVCFYIDKTFRRKGLSVALIHAAVEYAGSKGATMIEAYPVSPIKEKFPDVFAYTGLLTAFIKAGFTEVVRNGPTRPIVRKRLSATDLVH